MSEFLTKGDMGKLIVLGKKIELELGCRVDLPQLALPCASCRLRAVENMKKYLEIHGYTVKQ